MEFSVQQQGSITVMVMHGEVDAANADEITVAVREQTSANRNRIVIDLSEVGFMSSAGLRALLTSFKEVKTNSGDMRLAGPQEGVEMVFRMSGFSGIIPIHATVAEAIRAMG